MSRPSLLLERGNTACTPPQGSLEPPSQATLEKQCAGVGALRAIWGARPSSEPRWSGRLPFWPTATGRCGGAATGVRFGAEVTSARRNPHVDGEAEGQVPAYLLGTLGPQGEASGKKGVWAGLERPRLRLWGRGQEGHLQGASLAEAGLGAGRWVWAEASGGLRTGVCLEARESRPAGTTHHPCPWSKYTHIQK